MKQTQLLIEIGCEEIPARMIGPAAQELQRRLLKLLEDASLSHGAARSLGGSRRLAVRVDAVQARQEDRDVVVLGPPASVAFDDAGKPTKAAIGFAAKQGIDPTQLESRTTDKGDYVGFERRVEGKSASEIVADSLPAAVAAIPFPKTMRWTEGRFRWVRPVHWAVAVCDAELIEFELFAVKSGKQSAGHRFLHSGPVEIPNAAEYESALEKAHVIADPAARRKTLEQALESAARSAGGSLVPDAGLLDEVADLVEWPGIVHGEFEARFLELPKELLVTTLRHHQKCFSFQKEDGTALPNFAAVANTASDPGGHIRRGNEWVIGGRLDDARFFWDEDIRRPIADRVPELAGVIFHAKAGTFADKAERMAGIAARVVEKLGLDSVAASSATRAAQLCKVDLVSGTVGEFPELQGMAGGRLLEAAGAPTDVWRAVYEHYRPAGAEDALPETELGAVLSVADKLDTASALIGAGIVPTGSKDPFGLRRAMSGIFRIVIERGWVISLDDLQHWSAGAEDAMGEFLGNRWQKFLLDVGYTPNEIQAVLRPAVEGANPGAIPLSELHARLESIRSVRSRDDFAQLVDLTKRVDNILTKQSNAFESPSGEAGSVFEDDAPSSRDLSRLVSEKKATVARLEQQRDYIELIDLLAGFVSPVERFFEDVLVVDPDNSEATRHRGALLQRLRKLLTDCFDIRELAGQAERRST